jgi:hypothetical protein
MRRVAAVAVAALCTIVAGCSADGGGADSQAASQSADGEPGLTATLQRSTLFETRRAFLLSVVNAPGHEVQVGAIQLSSPLFETLPPDTRDARVRADGRAVAMPLPFGDAQCDDVAEEPPELITDVDGEEVHVALDESPAGMLSSLHDAECAAAAVLTEVELRLGDSWESTAPRTLEGEIELTQQRPGVTASVAEVLGNVIFSVGADDAPTPWLEVSDDQPSTSIHASITAARCDPHALTEYKRTFIFSAWVQVDGDEPARIDIRAEGGARAALEDLLAACLE